MPPASHPSSDSVSSSPPEAELKIRRRYHIHSALIVYAFVTLLIAIGAFNSQNNLLYWLFGLSIGLILVSGLLSGTMMMSLRVRRDALPDAVAGGPVRFLYTISNTSRFVPAFALTLTEMIEPGHVKGRLSRNLRKRREALPGATPSAQLDTEPLGFCAHVPPQRSVHAEVVAHASARGRLVTRGLRVSTSFPFGIIYKSIEVGIPGGCIVQPLPAQLPPDLIHNTWGATPGDTVQVRRAGLGDEFQGLRAYVPGDSPRLIAWKASARSVDLLIRQNAAPAPRRTWVLLDLARDHRPDDREHAIALAAGAIGLADRLNRSIGLIIPALGIFTGNKAGGWHVQGLLNDLALIPRGPIAPPSAAVPALSRTESRAAIHIHAGDPDTPAPPAPPDHAAVHLWSAHTTPEPAAAPRRRRPA